MEREPILWSFQGPRNYCKVPKSRVLSTDRQDMLALSWPSVPPQSPKRGSTTSRTRLPTIGKEVSSRQVKKEIPTHTNTLLRSPLGEKHIVQHQVEVADGLSGVLPP